MLGSFRLTGDTDTLHGCAPGSALIMTLLDFTVSLHRQKICNLDAHTLASPGLRRQPPLLDAERARARLHADLYAPLLQVAVGGGPGRAVGVDHGEATVLAAEDVVDLLLRPVGLEEVVNAQTE